jgi:hypothetical protein
MSFRFQVSGVMTPLSLGTLTSPQIADERRDLGGGDLNGY